MNHFLRYLLLLFICSNAFSQNIWEFPSRKNKIIIPFQLLNNSIILQPKVNNVPLNLILDTGSAYNILFAFPQKDSIAFYNTSKIKITGPGMEEPIDAYISKENKIEFKNIASKKLDVILLLEDEYNFTKSIEIPVHGILGADFFMDNKVEIQYDAKRIIVYKKETNRYNKRFRNFKRLPFVIKEKKPYIPVTITIDEQKTKDLELLVDTGLSDGLWVFEKELDIKNKKSITDYFGAGIGGNVYGKRVRFKTISFSDFQFKDPIVSVPDTISFLKKNILNERGGSIGGEVLKRFNILLDYKNQTMYLNENNNYNDKFYYNIAGFDVKHSGIDIIDEKISDRNTSSPKKTINLADIPSNNISFKYIVKPGIEISYIRKNSLADKAGLKEKDKIVSINGKKAYEFKLKEIIEILHKNTDEDIIVEVERNGKKIIFTLFLKQEI